MIEKKFSDLSSKEQNQILKEKFGLIYGESDRIYIGLLQKKATNAKNAIKLELTPVVRKGLKLKHLARAEGEKFFLTPIGEIIALGAKKIFS